MYFVTDTHALVWFLTANSRLSSKARSILADSDNFIIVPSIVMMEIKYLYQRKRITLSFEEALEKVEIAKNIILYPLDIFIATVAPVSLDIHDAIIVGTAIHLSKDVSCPVSLITVDKAISDSKLIPVIW